MDSAVSHEHEKPIYYKRDLFFTRLVVDRVKVDMMGHQLEYIVYYAGTSTSNISFSEFILKSADSRFRNDKLYTSYLRATVG